MSHLTQIGILPLLGQCEFVELLDGPNGPVMSKGKPGESRGRKAPGLPRKRCCCPLRWPSLRLRKFMGLSMFKPSRLDVRNAQLGPEDRTHLSEAERADHHRLDIRARSQALNEEAGKSLLRLALRVILVASAAGTLWTGKVAPRELLTLLATAGGESVVPSGQRGTRTDAAPGLGNPR